MSRGSENNACSDNNVLDLQFANARFYVFEYYGTSDPRFEIPRTNIILPTTTTTTTTTTITITITISIIVIIWELTVACSIQHLLAQSSAANPDGSIQCLFV